MRKALRMARRMRSVASGFSISMCLRASAQATAMSPCRWSGVTTVTDVAGFFFFLGLAVLAMRWAGM